MGPAIQNHQKHDLGASKVAIETLQVVVDGAATDGQAPAYSYIKEDGMPVRVELTMPSRSYTIRRIQKG